MADAEWIARPQWKAADPASAMDCVTPPSSTCRCSSSTWPLLLGAASIVHSPNTHRKRKVSLPAHFPFNTVNSFHTTTMMRAIRTRAYSGGIEARRGGGQRFQKDGRQSRGSALPLVGARRQQTLAQLPHTSTRSWHPPQKRPLGFSPNSLEMDAAFYVAVLIC